MASPTTPLPFTFTLHVGYLGGGDGVRAPKYLGGSNHTANCDGLLFRVHLNVLVALNQQQTPGQHLDDTAGQSRGQGRGARGAPRTVQFLIARGAQQVSQRARGRLDACQLADRLQRPEEAPCSEVLTPEATAFTDSVTTMVTTSSTWLARWSRPSSSRRAEGDQMAPGSASSLSAAASALFKYCSSRVGGGALVDFFLGMDTARAGATASTDAISRIREAQFIAWTLYRQ